MGVILLEALLVLAILAFMVWWTMFSGRKNKQPAPPAEGDARSAAPPQPPD